ncbi:MAG: toll/interleukin-1 receptor domain-containing protein [Verrucomicrobia bacterium]|nr:toll/interleukin-1 receptor domain-containing protein [Verrucomicrobiota bacterium]MDA1006180.1 toll/interleukin-1 receptor domain-containing protein [Verrucomicrobiota bacterium]
MSEESHTIPVVFISYSHDSREHKQWVARLASALLAQGVQVILDQWDLEPGDDVPKFAEAAVKAADRVLMICTEPYVRKANDGKGGVGYEAMIVTAELVRDLGTRKFIPIIRQDGGGKEVPDCVSTRLYVDFSLDDEFDRALTELLETLHKAKHRAKPPLGPDPFTHLNVPSVGTLEKRAAAEIQFEKALADPAEAYRLATGIIAADDAVTWRRLLRTLYQRAASDLVVWREADQSLPHGNEKDPSGIFEHAAQGVGFYMPLFACLVAGAQSGEEAYAGQLGWLDEINAPANWERGGYTYWTDFPELLVFVGQILVGGMLMESRSSASAYALGTTRVPNRHYRAETKPLFREPKVTGWPESMGHTCTIAWGFITKLIEDTTWIHSGKFFFPLIR